MVIKCPTCDSSNKDDAISCSVCGSSLAAKPSKVMETSEEAQKWSEVQGYVPRRDAVSYSGTTSRRQVFRISVSKEVMSKVMDHAKNAPDEEVIGLLIGRMDDQVLIVENAVSGETVRDKVSVIMPGESLAKIADDIVNKKVGGNIVGWYHSHPGYGVFMSEVDKDTQYKLHQFSPYVVALVLDPSTGEFKFFSRDQKSGTTQSLKSSQAHFYGPGEPQVPESFKPSTEPVPSPYTSLQSRWRSSFPALVLLLVIVVAIVTGTLLAAIYFGGNAPLKLGHQPVTSGIIGNDINLIANVTGGAGGAKNLTIYYKLSKDTVWKSNHMALASKEGNIYSYTIPGSDVIGNVDYYMIASDSEGNKVASPTTTVVIEDFEIRAADSQITIYVGQSKNTTVTIKSINGFNSPISLQASDKPPEIATVIFTPQRVTPPQGDQATSTVNVAVPASANTGEYEIKIQATYGQVTRTTSLKVLVSGFDTAISPSSVTVQRGKKAIYTVTLDVKKGFTDTISLNVTGLPSKGIDQMSIVLNKTIAAEGTTTLTVEIVTKYNVPVGTYNLKITATGGGIAREERVTLIIQ